MAQVVTARDDTRIEIGPGPLVMTAEEGAIERDVEAGLTDGVILLEETDRDEGWDSSNTVTYHVRAKILAPEGRDLADVVIPFNSEDSHLKRWWGHTILPDGTVLELAEDALEEQVIARTSWADYSVLKGSLPGVVPGCVIDFGYRVQVNGFIPPPPIALQREWPMRELRYRWVPWRGRTAAYMVTHQDQVEVEVAQTEKAVLVTAHDAPPRRSEPLGPPDSAIRAMLFFYYSDARGSVDDYWSDTGKAFEELAGDFAGSRSKGRKLLEETGLPAAPDLVTGLREAYDWIVANIENTSLRTYEEREAIKAAKEDEEFPDTAKETMKARKGSSFDLDMLFITFARALGADAHLVLVADRTTTFWQPKMYSAKQFDGVVVAVSGAGDELVFAAPGAGLPFGMVPWWFSAIPGGLAHEDGLRQVMVSGSRPQQNVSSTRVEMRFEVEDEVLVVDWSRTGTGEAGYGEMLRLRRRSPEKREERLLKLCGEGPDIEVAEAAAPGLLDSPPQRELECTCELYGQGPVGGVDSFRVGLDGPWIESLPDLTEETRTLPVILPYPRIDTTMFTVAAPPGYQPVDPPDPISIRSPLGGYSLRVVRGPAGYEVARSLTLAFLRIEAADYPKLLEFLNAVRAADRTQLLFTSVEPT